jgi:hypothetical protein
VCSYSQVLHAVCYRDELSFVAHESKYCSERGFLWSPKLLLLFLNIQYIVKQRIFITETYVRKEVSEQVSKMFSHYLIFFEINIAYTGDQILMERFPIK